MAKLIDLKGQKFGRWTVLRYDENWRKNGGTGGAAWICQCECGTIKSIRGTELRQGRSKSCGCLQRKNRAGERFGKLTVIKRDLTKLNDSYWICNCNCGTKNKSILKKHLVQGKIISCGCEAFHSQGEKKIKQLLDNNNISYQQEYIFENFYYSNTKRHPRYDFFVNNQYLIEFDGRQHFETNTWNKTKKELIDTKNKDEYKNNYAREHNIPLIRIPYTHLNKITLEDIQLETSNFIV